MPRSPAEVIVLSICEERLVVIVDMTVDGVPQRFRFDRIVHPVEVWGSPTRYLRPNETFAEVLGAGTVRKDVRQLIDGWVRGKPVKLPARFTKP